MKKIIICCILFLFIFNGFAQEKFKYSNKLNPIKVSISNQIKGINFIDATTYLPKNFKSDGTVDYTHFLQKAINENKNILMPDFKVLINDNGLKIPSDRNLYFRTSSQLILKGTTKEKYAILSIENSNNISIINPHLVGDRKVHLGKSGEWGMGINVLSANNVKIFNPNISNCWGDGIYINRLPGQRNSSEIFVQGGMIDNNRRNAISIISGSNISIYDILLSNQNGTAPEGGLVIEPNNNNDILQEISLININTLNNNEMGIGIVLTKLIGPNQKQVSIKINNHKDFQSSQSILLAGLRSSYKSNFKRINGTIKISNSSWNGRNGIGRFGSNFYYMPSVELNDIKSTNSSINSFKNDLIKRKIKVNN
ncbi:hypothetical protein [Sphingobacterium endophyticum]|uniref:hypothetical protein n=1 Tax=Sphingobacterium endophyticum TaxID=2546448 RepID=UPI0012E1C8F7|nr:hypothetical protein [Sphingobacterium endophyticum]